MSIASHLERKKQLDDAKETLRRQLKERIPQSLREWTDSDVIIEKLLLAGTAWLHYDENACIDRMLGDIVEAERKLVMLADAWRGLAGLRIRSTIREPLFRWGNKHLSVSFSAL